MSDRAAIVTGGSRGIGFSLAETLGEEGFGLTITARKAETIERAAEDLRAKGYKVEPVTADVADEEAIREAVSHHRARYGRLDVLVNSAGIGVGARATNHETRHVDRQLGVNLRAIILLYRECLELLRSAGA